MFEWGKLPSSSRFHESPTETDPSAFVFKQVAGSHSHRLLLSRLLKENKISLYSLK